MGKIFEPVTIMLPVIVAAKLCGTCPEMKLSHMPDLLVVPDVYGGHFLEVKQHIVCEHLEKCQRILLAKEKADEQDP